MMVARRRASAMRALLIVDRWAIANAQSLSLSWPLVAGQHDVGGLVQQRSQAPIAAFRDGAG
jgi:hypothetical protein